MIELIREFEESDEAEVAELGARVWGSEHYWVNETCAEEFEYLEEYLNSENTFLVAEIDGDIIGYAVAIDKEDRQEVYPKSDSFEEKTSGKTAYLSELAVDPSYQHQHIGSTLLEEILDRLKPKYDKVILRTNLDSKKTKGLYSKFDFYDLEEDDPNHPERTYLMKKL